MALNTLSTFKVKGAPCMCFLCPRVSNFSPLCSTNSRFGGTCIVDTNAPNDSKLECYEVKGIPHTCYMNAKLKSICHSTSSPFRVTDTFETSAPQNDLEHYKIKRTPYMRYYCSRVTNISPFRSCRSTASHFLIAGHFERSAPNHPKMTSITIRSDVPHIFVTTVPESQISIRFTLDCD